MVEIRAIVAIQMMENGLDLVQTLDQTRLKAFTGFIFLAKRMQRNAMGHRQNRSQLSITGRFPFMPPVIRSLHDRWRIATIQLSKIMDQGQLEKTHPICLLRKQVVKSQNQKRQTITVLGGALLTTLGSSSAAQHVLELSGFTNECQS